MEKILEVKNIVKKYGDGCKNCIDGIVEKNYCPHCKTIYALNNVSFELYNNEILGVVGESGSGKSTLMQAIHFDLEVDDGELIINNENVFATSDQRKYYIKNNSYGKVYQNPSLGLKYNLSAISNIAEKLIGSGNMNVHSITETAKYFLRRVEIPLDRMQDYPNQFSGGQQQRIQIAKALSNYPPILLLDEITTGLDLSVQASVLDLIKELQREFGCSVILVSHDLGVIKMLAQRCIVLLDGKIVESGLTDQILEDPQHEYTQKLVYSLL